MTTVAPRRACLSATGTPQSRTGLEASPMRRLAAFVESSFDLVRPPPDRDRPQSGDSSEQAYRPFARARAWSRTRSTRESSRRRCTWRSPTPGSSRRFFPDVEGRLPCFDMDHGGPELARRGRGGRRHLARGGRARRRRRGALAHARVPRSHRPADRLGGVDGGAPARAPARATRRGRRRARRGRGGTRSAGAVVAREGGAAGRRAGGRRSARCARPNRSRPASAWQRSGRRRRLSA